MSFFDEVMLPLLTDDLRKPEFRGNPNPVAGHCYIVAEALYHWLHGFMVKPMFIRHDGQSHWFLWDVMTNSPIDPTASQFKTPVPYEKARGKGFLTKFPSKRAQYLMERMP